MSSKFTIHFFTQPSGPNIVPYCFSNPSGDFMSIDEARDVAKASARLDAMRAHSFVIEQDGVDLERWERDGDGWKQTPLDAPAAA